MNLTTTSRPGRAFRTTAMAAALAAGCGMAFAAAGSTATIVFDPTVKNVNQGDIFTIDLTALNASNYIGAYDFTLAFGTAGIASLQSVSFAGALGATDGVDVIRFTSLPSFGEVSLLGLAAELGALQDTQPFDLATLTFKALAGGTTTVSLTPNLAGDFDGDPLTLELGGATINVLGVPAIPEPSTYALMALGLAAVGFAAKRKTAR
jgi:PEP-CTERM motif